MNDNKLIGLFQQRNEQAVAETQQEYGNYIYKIAFRVLGSIEDAEECKNDVLLKIWETIPPHIPESFQAYIGTLTRNLSLDTYRKQHSSKRQTEFTALLQESSQWVGDDTTLSLHELSDSISLFLDKVSEEKQFMFLARYYYGYSVCEIAKKRKISESKVKTTLFRMRKELQKQLEKDGVWQ